MINICKKNIIFITSLIPSPHIILFSKSFCADKCSRLIDLIVHTKISGIRVLCPPGMVTLTPTAIRTCRSTRTCRRQHCYQSSGASATISPTVFKVKQCLATGIESFTFFLTSGCSNSIWRLCIRS